MTSRWDDVNARARGLATHLLGEDALAALGRCPDLTALARALEERGVLRDPVAAPGAAALELALRRAAAGEVRLVRRWLGSRSELVAVALDAEDRRSLRALLRGAVSGASAEARLAGLIPTPALPERLLRELAERVRVAEQASLLVAAGHPCGAPLLAEIGRRATPDLFTLELTLARVYAERAVAGARRAGGVLLEYVRLVLDLENCRAALLLAERAAGEPATTAYLPGGGQLARADFERAAAAPDAVAAARLLSGMLGGGTFAVLLLRHARGPEALESAIEEALLRWLRQRARLEPLGPAPLLLWFLRLRRQQEALARIVWSVELGVPPEARLPHLTEGAA